MYITCALGALISIWGRAYHSQHINFSRNKLSIKHVFDINSIVICHKSIIHNIHWHYSNELIYYDFYEMFDNLYLNYEMVLLNLEEYSSAFRNTVPSKRIRISLEGCKELQLLPTLDNSSELCALIDVTPPMEYLILSIHWNQLPKQYFLVHFLSSWFPSCKLVVWPAPSLELSSVQTRLKISKIYVMDKEVKNYSWNLRNPYRTLVWSPKCKVSIKIFLHDVWRKWCQNI